MAERHSWAVGAVAGVGQVDELDARLTIGGLIVPSGAVTSHGGMFPAATTPGDVTATTPTPNGEVHVAPFRGALQSNRPGGGGVYIICLDAIKTIDVLGTAPADPANPRIDLIVFQQSDTYHGDADSDFVVRHVVGTPAVVPVDPDPTAGGLSPDYILKARINVAAGAITIEQADIENEDPGITVAVGGLLPVPNATWRDAIVNPYNGMPIYRQDRDWVEIRDQAAAWRVQGVAVCSSLADRTAAITNPANGTTSYRTDNKALDVFDGAVWRGARQVNYDTPAATGSGANAAFAAAQNTTYTMASLVIPDPGFPYRIAGRAGMRVTNVSSALGYASHAGSITVDSTVQPEISAAMEDGVVTASFLEVTGTNFPATGWLNLPYRRAKTVYTGGHTVRFLFKTGLQGTCGWGPLNQQADYYFQVDVVPA